jgi:beta-xylosidase
MLVTVAASAEFQPGEVWLDTDGNPIQAHGGGILTRGDTYYWYGEDRTPGGNGAVACYSSTNLYDWKREGVVLSREALPRVDGRGTFVERPKVIFNESTGKYVMWTHLEQRRYQYARAGIAISDSPTDPFTFFDAIRPITNDFEFPDNDPNQQKQFGGTFRDMNLFVDDDGSAYVFYASEGNWTMYVVRLNADYTGPETPAILGKTWARILVRQMREAPAPFKHNGQYYLITSACTGWRPNAANYATAENILGPWTIYGNPCVGTNADTTFDTQSTFVLPVRGNTDAFIFMADHWKPQNLPDSRYVWLPFTIKDNGKFDIGWRERWDSSVFSEP